MIKKNMLCVAMLTIGLSALSLYPGSARDRQPIDAVPGDYAGSATLGDKTPGALIPVEFLPAIDLGLRLRKTGAQWSGSLSLKRWVTTAPAGLTSPDCREVTKRELEAPLESIMVRSDRTFQAVSGPLRFCVSDGKAVERRVRLSGRLATSNNCEHVEIRGDRYDNYAETIKGLIALPGGRDITVLGTFSLTKVKDPEGYQAPENPEECPDWNP